MLHMSDFRYALRLLKKTPGFTALTIFVLAGGLAISLYTFAILNTMMYKALPIPDGDAVVRIVGQRQGSIRSIDSYLLSEMRASDIKSLDGIGAYVGTAITMVAGDSSRSFNATKAEWNIFEFTRVKPLMGRGFIRADSTVGAENVAVISHKVWQSAFASDPSIIDKVVMIDRQPTRIVGVMPKGYSFPGSSSVWLPLTENELRPTVSGVSMLNAYARIAPGASKNEVRTELDSLLGRAQARAGLSSDAENQKLDGMLPLTFQSAQTYPEGPFVFAILNAISFFILLLSCVNVGNMLLARTNERIKEIAVRVALGAPTGRLMMQMVLESVIVCIAGTAIALLLVAWGLKATNGFMATAFEGGLPYWWHWHLDFPTVTAAFIFVPAMIFVVSVMPVYTAIHVNASSMLRDGTRGAQGRTSGRIARVLVTAQIALISVVLLVGTAMGIVAHRAGNIDYGIDSRNLLTMNISIDEKKYDSPEKQNLFFDRLLEELRSKSDIETAVISTNIGTIRFGVDDMEYSTITDYPDAALILSSDMPEQIGTRLIEGRNFDKRDSATGLKSIVVSDYIAKTYWPGQSALGKRMRLLDENGGTQEQRVVVGVISNVRRGENVLLTDKSTFAALYVPFAQSAISTASILVRHSGSESSVGATMMQAVSTIDPYVVPAPPTNFTESQKKLTLVATTMTSLFIQCGIFAILLAMTGIYGLSSNNVIRRTHEIGLRRAIGATDNSIIRLFMKEGGRQLTFGFVISALISIAILFMLLRFAGIDAATLTVIGVLVLLVITALVMIAIYIATRRVVGQEPSEALRYD